MMEEWNYDPSTQPMEENITLRRDRKRAFSRIGFGLSAMFLLTQVFAAVFAVAAVQFAPGFASSDWFVWVLTQAPMYLIGFPVLLLILKSIPVLATENQRTLSGKELCGLFTINFAALYLFNMVTIVINSGIGFLKGRPVENPLDFTGGVPLQTFLFGVLIGPVMEEIVFRKILLGKSLKYGEGIAVFVSAFCFSLFHGNLSQMIYAFALGLLYAYITVKSGTIKYSVCLHIVTNAMGMLLPIWVMSKGEMLLTLYGFVIMALVIAGIVVFVRNRSRFTISKGEGEPPFRENVKALLSAPGMIVYMVICFIMVVFSTLI